MYRALILCASALAAGAACQAQGWEAGVAGGFGFYRDINLTGPPGNGRAGFGPRFLLSGFAGHQLAGPLSAEFRYTYQDGDLKVSSAGSEANLDGDAQSLHCDLLFHLPHVPLIRPFIEAGGGLKIYSGSGSPSNQPLQQFAHLSSAHQAIPLITWGAGFSIPITHRLRARFDFRDFATPFPDRVIVPAPGIKAGGWLHDFAGMIGFVFHR